MAPVAEGSESQCQLFSPYLWSAVKSGMDSNHDGKTTMEEVFRSAMEVYNSQRAAIGMKPVYGVYDHSLPELRSISQLQKGNVIVEVSASWCGACKAQRQELNNLRSMLGSSMVVLVLDYGNGALLAKLESAAGEEIGGGLPRLFYFKDGKPAGTRFGLTPLAALLKDSQERFGISPGDNDALVRGLKGNLSGTDRGLAEGSLISLMNLGVLDEDVLSGFRKLLKTGTESQAVQFIDFISGLPSFPSLSGKLGPSALSEMKAIMEKAFRKEVRLFMAQLQVPDPHLMMLASSKLRTIAIILRDAEGMPRPVDWLHGGGQRVPPGITLAALREEMGPFISGMLRQPANSPYFLYAYSIEMAGYISSYESVPRLEEIARGETGYAKEHRAAAIIALGDIAYPPSLDVVLALSKSSEAKIAGSAIRALSRFYMDDITQTDSGGIITRGVIVPAAEREIIAGLTNPSPYVRAASLLSLGDIAEGRNVPHIARLIKDPTFQVRVCMVSALAQIGGPEALKVLEIIARTDAEGQIRNDALGVISILREKSGHHLGAAL